MVKYIGIFRVHCTTLYLSLQSNAKRHQITFVICRINTITTNNYQPTRDFWLPPFLAKYFVIFCHCHSTRPEQRDSPEGAVHQDWECMCPETRPFLGTILARCVDVKPVILWACHSQVTSRPSGDVTVTGRPGQRDKRVLKGNCSPSENTYFFN